MWDKNILICAMIKCKLNKSSLRTKYFHVQKHMPNIIKRLLLQYPSQNNIKILQLHKTKNMLDKRKILHTDAFTIPFLIITITT